jgi:hypothetical protein
LSHLTSCTPTKSSLYLANSPTTVISDPDLYRLLTFHVPNIISLFHCLGRAERSVRFRGFLWYFVTWFIFYGEELLAPRPTPKLEDHPLSAVRDCLFKIFAAALLIWRPFLNPQPEDAPCRGDRDPLITFVIISKVLPDILSTASFQKGGFESKSAHNRVWYYVRLGSSLIPRGLPSLRDLRGPYLHRCDSYFLNITGFNVHAWMKFHLCPWGNYDLPCAVCPSARNNSAPTDGLWWNLIFVLLFFCENVLRKFKFHWPPTRITGTLREDIVTFVTIFR